MGALCAACEDAYCGDQAEQHTWMLSAHLLSLSYRFGVGGSFPASRIPDTLLGMTDICRLHRALVARVLGSGGKAPPELRRAAFDAAGLDDPLRTLVDKVAHNAQRVSDDDIAAARAEGLSEDQIFEIVVCAAVGRADRQYSDAIAALAAARGGAI